MARVRSCPAPRILILPVHLRYPLAGRTIYGRSPQVLAEPRQVFGYRGSNREPVTLPRLPGFSPRDAERALAFGYLRARVLTRRHGPGLPRVIAQQPGARHTL